MPTPLDIPRQRPPARVDAPATASRPTLGQVKSALYIAMEQAVRLRRMEGATWSAVADELGVSKTAAFRTWRHVDEYSIGIVAGEDGASFRCMGTGVIHDPRRPVGGTVLEHLATHVHEHAAIDSGL